MPNENEFVDMIMRTVLNPDQKAALDERLKNHAANVEKFGLMDNAELAEKATRYLHQIRRPDFPKGTPVYDVVMHDIIIPEMIKRLRD
jgi:hypothetical protein